MYATLLILLSVPGAEPTAVPRVTALLDTHLGFAEADRAKVADAAVKLLASCGSSCSSTEKDFESLSRQCHLHVTFSKAREVAVRGDKTLKVDELIVSFPTNTGGIWVRCGEDYFYYTKFAHEHVLEIHELLKNGKPQ